VAELDDGRRITQETRTWDETRGVTLSMRSKEEAHDYRYFPDPDLPPLVIYSEWVERVRQGLPELPGPRRARFVSEFGLPEYDAGVLTSSPGLADFFECTVGSTPTPRPPLTGLWATCCAF
jgi:aspartyl-tRNA(Asn)/glutamyl-tRNA(Gln) amidotransferase subunit B